MTRHDPSSRSGVSLIIVLGLLSVLAILAVAFAQSMRNARLSSRHTANALRAEQLVEVAQVRALEAVQAGMIGYTYPCWELTNGVWGDAMSSAGTNRCDLLRGSVSNHIPGALWNDAVLANSTAGWSNIVSEADGRTHGRIAYLVVNVSGLLDANVVGGTNWANGTDPGELDLSGLPELWETDPGDLFYTQRSVHGRYESVDELNRLNSGLTQPAANLFVFSYDLDRDQFFVTTNTLGTPQADSSNLVDKASITLLSYLGVPPYEGYLTNAGFLADYWDPLTNHLARCGFDHADGLAWSIINYQDPDRVPQNASPTPWLESVGQEAVPLINEIVLRSFTNAAIPSNHYEVAVELWFPFVPATVAAAEFSLEVAIACGPTRPDASAFTNPASILSAGSTNVSFSIPIGAMEYGAATEFLYYTSPTGRLISFSTNGVDFRPISSSDAVWVLPRVVGRDASSNEVPVDQAGTNWWWFPAEEARSATDPYLNATDDTWTNVARTLGAMNDGCSPYSPEEGSGVPRFHPDRDMVSAGELGLIPLADGSSWHTISLLTPNGAALLDWFTVRWQPHNMATRRGLVSLSSKQPDVLATLFDSVRVPDISATGQLHRLPAQQIIDLVNTLTNWTSYRSYSELFFPDTQGSNLVQRFAACAPTNAPDNDYFREAALRGITEWVTFRQNLFLVISAAQAYAPADTTPVAERRTISLIVRDAYTGRLHTRYRQRLDR